MFKKSTVHFGQFSQLKNQHFKNGGQVFFMCDQREEPEDVTSSLGNLPGVTAWAVPCKVLEPMGREGSFAPMDEQAKKIADFIGSKLVYGVPVFVTCVHGELRSPAVAMGLYEISDGKIIGLNGAELPQMGTFGSRTAGIIGCRLNEILDKREAEEEFADLGNIHMPNVFVMPETTVQDLKLMVAKVKKMEWDLIDADVGGYSVLTPIGKIQISAVYGIDRKVDIRVQTHRSYPVNLASEHIGILFPKYKGSN